MLNYFSGKILENMKLTSITLTITVVLCYSFNVTCAQSQTVPSKEQVIRNWYGQFRLLRTADYKFSVKGEFAKGNIATYNYLLKLNGDKYRLEVDFPQLTSVQQKKGFLTQSVSTYDGTSFYQLSISNGSAVLNKSRKPTNRTALGAMPIHIIPFSFAIDDITANYAPLQHMQNPQTWNRVKSRIDRVESGSHDGSSGFWINMRGVASKQSIKVFARKNDFYPIYSALYLNGKLQAEGTVEKVFQVKAGSLFLNVPQKVLIKGSSGSSSDFVYQMQGQPKINQVLKDSGFYSITRSQTTIYNED